MRGKELIAFLHDDNIRKFALKTKYFKNKNVDFASDFDLFSALCDSISLFAGHRVRASLIDSIESGFGERINPTDLILSEYRKALWQEIFSEERASNASNKLKGSATGLSDFEYCEKKISLKTIDLSASLDTHLEDIFDALDYIMEKIENNGIEGVRFDMRKIEYVRTNDFFAKESYGLLRQELDNGGAFLIWLLCRILMKANLTLILMVDNFNQAKKILELFSILRLNPQIIISFDAFEKEDYKSYTELVLSEYKKSISLEPYFSKEMRVSDATASIKELISDIPIVFLKVGYGNKGAELFFKALDIALDGIAEGEKNIIFNYLYMGE